MLLSRSLQVGGEIASADTVKRPQFKIVRVATFFIGIPRSVHFCGILCVLQTDKCSNGLMFWVRSIPQERAFFDVGTSVVT